MIYVHVCIDKAIKQKHVLKGLIMERKQIISTQA